MTSEVSRCVRFLLHTQFHSFDFSDITLNVFFLILLLVLFYGRYIFRRFDFCYYTWNMLFFSLARCLWLLEESSLILFLHLLLSYFSLVRFLWHHSKPLVDFYIPVLLLWFLFARPISHGIAVILSFFRCCCCLYYYRYIHSFDFADIITKLALWFSVFVFVIIAVLVIAAAFSYCCCCCCYRLFPIVTILSIYSS